MLLLSPLLAEPTLKLPGIDTVLDVEPKFNVVVDDGNTPFVNKLPLIITDSLELPSTISWEFSAITPLPIAVENETPLETPLW